MNNVAILGNVVILGFKRFDPNFIRKFSADGDFLPLMFDDDWSKRQSLEADARAAFAQAKAQELRARIFVVNANHLKTGSLLDLFEWNHDYSYLDSI